MPSDLYDTKNALLAYLSSKSPSSQLLSELTVVTVPKDDILYEPRIQQHYAYFPLDSVISLLGVTEEGSTVETAVIGNEGMLGACLVMGATPPTYAAVQEEGQAYRVGAERIKREFETNPAFQDLLLRYTHTLITQMGQIALCNRYHCIEQRLCRWLLMMSDRLPGDELAATHELISNGLGVRREGVTEAARRLQEAKLIQYARGHITILDRLGLEARSCECYQVVVSELVRVFPPLNSAPAEGTMSRSKGVIYR